MIPLDQEFACAAERASDRRTFGATPTRDVQRDEAVLVRWFGRFPQLCGTGVLSGAGQ
jgi:hypothetical protein